MHDTQNTPNARKVGRLNGKNVFRFHVLVRCNDSRQCRTVARHRFQVLAHTAADAANMVRDMFETRPETEIITFGPKGGETHRFMGWESVIGTMMWQSRSDQLSLEV